MTLPELYHRAMNLFDTVCDLPPQERTALLNERCADDDDLRREVESLLAQDANDGGAIADSHQGAGGQMLAAGIAENMDCGVEQPERIGRYRIIREVGRGGMGTVYEAEQESPRRRVALKVIRTGMATRELLKRFEREAHVLGQLQHPGIAHIYESSVASIGTNLFPFFAMEFVDGIRLDEYVKRRDLNVRQCLTLMARIADAVQHAHQKGIVHRDLKPANILIAEDQTTTDAQSNSDSEGTRRLTGTSFDTPGQPKILDFGIARVTDADIQTATIQTDIGQLVGTLAYMSPEQVAGDSNDIDTRCDVYALGVVLYEILAERPPLRLAGQPIPEAARIIREKDPERLSSINARLRGDVDTIVARAMEKDKDRRYASAAEFAADIRRHLNDEPIEARPASTFYQLRKFARRNKGLVGGLAATFVVLVLGIIGTSIGLASALKSNRQLEKIGEFQSAQLGDVDVQLMGQRLRATILDAVSEDRRSALSTNLVEVNFTDMARDTLEQNLFNRSITAINEQFKDQPLIRARLLQTVAGTLRQLGMPDLAVDPQRRALDLHKHALGNDHRDTLTSMHNVGVTYLVQGELDSAEPFLVECLEGFRRIAGPNDPDMQSAIAVMGDLSRERGKYDEAENYYRQALDRRRSALGEDHPDTLNSMHDLARLLTDKGEATEAESLYRKSLEARRRVLGDEHPSTLTTMNDFGAFLSEKGRLDESEALSREALEIRRRVQGNDHPDTVVSIGNLGFDLESQGKYEAAEVLYLESVERHRRMLGDDHPLTLIAIGNLGYNLNAQGKSEAAEPLYRESLERARRVLGNDHPQTLTAIGNLGVFLLVQKRFEEAEPLYAESLAGRRRSLGDDHPSTLNAIYNMGNLLVWSDKLDEAEPFCRQALEGYRRVRGNDHPGTIHSLLNLGGLFEAQKKYEEAEAHFREAFESRRRVFGEDHPDTSRAIEHLANVLSLRNQWAEAEELWRLALEIARRAETEADKRVAWALENLGANLLDQMRHAEAEPFLVESLDIRRRILPEKNWRIWSTQSLLGEAIAIDAKRFAEAEQLLIEAEEGLIALADAGETDPEIVAEARTRMAKLYESANKLDDAEKWRTKAESQGDPRNAARR